MAEYIDRDKLLSILNDKYESIADINSIIIDMKSVDVIERENVKNLIKAVIEDNWELDYALERLKEI